jgi:hypothetical protein
LRILLSPPLAAWLTLTSVDKLDFFFVPGLRQVFQRSTFMTLNCCDNLFLPAPPLRKARGIGCCGWLAIMLVGVVVAVVAAYLLRPEKPQIIFTKTMQGIFKHKGMLTIAKETLQF